MNMSKILTVAIVLTSLNAYVFTMDQVPVAIDEDSLKNFRITFDDTDGQQKTFYFCTYDFEVMNEQDQNGFLSLYDYEGVLSTVNSHSEAERFSKLAAEQPEQFFDGAIKRQKNWREKTAGQQAISYAWLVKEYDEQGQEHVVGQVGLGSYNDVKPSQYADATLVEVGITGHKSYRGQRYATRLIPIVMEYLRKFDEFKNVFFCFRTESTNRVTHKLAISFGFELVMSIPTELDLGGSKVQVNMDLFVLPSSSRS